MNPLPTQLRNRRGGFTLVEVLVALMLTGIILAVAMDGISLAMYASGDARRKLEATSLAENKLAEMTAGLILQMNTTGGAQDFGPEWPEYRWEASSIALGGDTPDLTEVKVRVLWRSRGADRWVALSTLVYTGAGTIPPETASTAAPSSATGGGR
jgi:prepilin-type N-terminal cleavage/methylation domain-containing protein